MEESNPCQAFAGWSRRMYQKLGLSKVFLSGRAGRGEGSNSYIPSVAPALL